MFLSPDEPGLSVNGLTAIGTSDPAPSMASTLEAFRC